MIEKMKNLISKVNNDFDHIFSCLDDNVSFVGERNFDNAIDLYCYLDKIFMHNIKIELDEKSFKEIVNNDNICVIKGLFDINNKKYHLTITYDQKQEKIKHIHASLNQLNIFTQLHSIALLSYYLDENFTFNYFNDALLTLLGYTYDEFLKMCHNHAIEIVYEKDKESVVKGIHRSLSFEDSYQISYRIRKFDGSLLWVNEQGQKIIDEHGDALIFAYINDITSLMKKDRKLELQKQKYSMALKDNSITILEYDIKMDRMTIDIQEESKKKIYDHYFDYLSSSNSTVFKEDKQLLIDIFQLKIKGPVVYREYDKVTKQCVRKILDYEIIYDENNEAAIILATARDITNEWNDKIKLEERIYKDPLTQQLNLEGGKQKIESYLSNKDFNESCALLILDIDYFKTINDTYGHLFGNEVLVLYTECLNQAIENNDFVVRIGGDEFMILLVNKDIDKVIKIVEDICYSVRNLKFKNKPLTLTTSIGVFYLKEGNDPFELLFKNADYILYEVKKKGRNNYRVCTDLDAYHREKRKNEYRYSTLKEKIQILLKEGKQYKVFELMGEYYHVNRIAIFKIEDDLTYFQENQWISSRAYESFNVKGKINHKDYDYMFLHKAKEIIYSNKQSPFSQKLTQDIEMGVALTVLLALVESTCFRGFISFTNYDTQREWSIKQRKELNELSYLICESLYK